MCVKCSIFNFALNVSRTKQLHICLKAEIHIFPLKRRWNRYLLSSRRGQYFIIDCYRLWKNNVSTWHYVILPQYSLAEIEAKTLPFSKVTFNFWWFTGIHFVYKWIAGHAQCKQIYQIFQNVHRSWDSYSIALVS